MIDYEDDDHTAAERVGRLAALKEVRKIVVETASQRVEVLLERIDALIAREHAP